MSQKEKIFIHGNYPELGKILEKLHVHDNVEFKVSTDEQHSRYHLFIINEDGVLENTNQQLISLYQKCHQNQSKLVILYLSNRNQYSDKKHLYQKLLSELGGPNPLHRLVFTQDLYDENLSPALPFSKSILNSVSLGVLRISQKGKNYFYPLHVEDLAKGILKIFFLSNTAGRNFALLGEKISDLDLAYSIKSLSQDISPGLDIEASLENIPENQELNNLSLSTQANLDWKPEEDFENLLRKYFRQNQNLSSSKVEAIDSKPKFGSNKISFLKKIFHHAKKEKTRIEFNLKAATAKIFVVGLLIIIITLSSSAILAIYSFDNLNRGLESLNKGDINSSSKSLSRASNTFKLALDLYLPYSPLVNFFSRDADTQIQNLVSLSEYTHQTIENIQQTIVLGEQVYKQIYLKKPQGYQDVSLALKSNLSLINENLLQIQSLVDSKQLPQFIYEKIGNRSQIGKIEDLKSKLSDLDKIIGILPELLTATEKNSVFLITDNSELKGIGGNIQTAILVTTNTSKVENIKTYSSSELDTLLGGKAVSPGFISLKTGQPGWLARDLGEYADFNKNAQIISWYFEKLIGKPLDFIVSIDRSVLAKYIENKGGVTIESQHVSSQDYLSALFEDRISLDKNTTDLFLQDFLDGGIKLVDLANLYLLVHDSGNLSAWSKNENSNRILSTLGLSGSVNKFHCQSAVSNYSRCTVITGYLNESNFFRYPINNFLDREVIHQISLTSSAITHQYQINYHYNQDIKDQNRSYNPIFQIYLPQNTKLESATLNDQTIQIKNLYQENNSDLTYFQFDVDIPLNQDSKLNLNFSTPSDGKPLNSSAFTFVEVRQAGIRDKGEILSLTLPPDVPFSILSGEAQIKSNTLLYRYPTRTASFSVGIGAPTQ